MTIPFRTYWRSLSRNKALAAINVAGLALGMASCLFIFLYVHDELRYDGHHANAARIFRITSDFVSTTSTDHMALTPPVLASGLKEGFPQIEETARFLRLDRGVAVRHQGQLFVEKMLCRADHSAFNIFSYTVLEGNLQTLLTEPRQVVLTRGARKKYFGDAAALGKTLEIGGELHAVAGVIEDLPQNSDLGFFMLLSMDNDAKAQDWFAFNYHTYVLIKKEAAHAGMEQTLEGNLAQLTSGRMEAEIRKYDAPFKIIFHTQPFKGLHFATSLMFDTPKGNIRYVYLFSVAAVLILIIACLNYINFAIAQSMARSREVGIRKVIGASPRQLVAHYIGESFMVTFMALLFAVVVVCVALPAFNTLVEKEFTWAHVAAPAMVLTALGILVTVSLLAGSYSAFYTAAIRPVHALRGMITVPAGQLVRKFSLVVQFAISTGLLVGAVAIGRQMTFMQRFDPGFRRDHILVIDAPRGDNAHQHVPALMAALRGSQAVTHVSAVTAGSVPGMANAAEMIMHSDDKSYIARFTYADEVFVPLLGLEMREGRNLDVNRPADRREAVLVNEAYVQMMGWKQPLQEKIPWGSGDKQVVGVIRNFHYQSLHNPIEPYFIAYEENSHPAHLLVRLESTTDLSDMVAMARQQWQQFFADEPFVYRFVDESLAAQYHKEQVVKQVLTAFTIVALAIAFFGLAGLTALSIYQRRKEIGIRKIIGARLGGLVWLFFREYGKLILVAFVITYPVTIYLLHTWLETFARHIAPGLWVYLLTGMGVVALALATAWAGIIRMARANPASLIRD